MKGIFEELKNKKVLILGFGKEGQSTYKFLRKYFPDKKLGIADAVEKKIKFDKNLELYFGRDYLKSLKDFGLIIKTPGIPYKLSAIKKARKRGVKFTSQTQIFFELVKGKIIGVTGTAGKSTTASLIHKILKTAGLRSVLLGNIGKPVLDYLDKDSTNTIFVFELSSHQLFDLTRSLHVAVFLNIFPEHLDYYESFNHYRKAKANIAKYQTEKDFFIYNSSFSYLCKVARKTKARKLSFSLRRKSIIEEIIKLDRVPLLGEHNLNNVMASILVCRALGLKDSDIRAGIERFKPLKHRLERVGVYQGVIFVNDSISTTPETTIAALKTFKSTPLVLIMGGFDRGLNYDRLGEIISGRKDIKTVILIGEVAGRIKKSLKRAKYKGKILDLKRSKMIKIVREAFENTPKGGVVLLSPAAASFDMFKDYRDRGGQFKIEIERLIK
jgi:UDP-N-acetylmuramoylalanine--D-glutamate ligase